MCTEFFTYCTQVLKKLETTDLRYLTSDFWVGESQNCTAVRLEQRANFAFGKSYELRVNNWGLRLRDIN